jgi:hypothetical protein
MIRFNMNGNVGAIDFSYEKINGSRVTAAKIFVNDELQYIGVAAQDSRDRDVKESARKAALKRLMRFNRLQRSDRTIIWNAYHNRGNDQIRSHK